MRGFTVGAVSACALAVVTCMLGCGGDWFQEPPSPPPPPLTVTNLDPAPGDVLASAPTQIVVTFSTDVDPATVDGTTFTLIRSGGDGWFDDGNEVVIVADSVSLTAANEATMDLTSASLSNDVYRVVILGATPPPGETVGHWTFDGESGTTATDSSGNGNHGSVNGANWTIGVLGEALEFNGTSDYVALPASLVGSSLGSVSMWVNTTKNFTEAGHVFYGAQVTGGDGSGAENELHVSFTLIEGVHFFINGASKVEITSPGSYADGAWHHVAATWNIAGEAVLYVDGSQVGSTMHTGNAFDLQARIRLGRPDQATRFYGGLLDDVRLYDRALTAEEAAALADPFARGVEDVLGRNLDGEFSDAFPSGDGQEGGDFVATFVVGTSPVIACNAASLSFAANEGGANPQAQALLIWNPGVSTLNWQVSDAATWLTPSPGSGTCTTEEDEVTIAADITGLTAGTYTATITVTDPGATNSPQTVDVSLFVLDGSAALWHLDVSVPETLKIPSGQIWTGTYRVATLAPGDATFEFLEITYTDECWWGRNYDARGLLHTSDVIDRFANYSGNVGAGQIGRNTGGYPDIMTFYARYDFNTLQFETSTPGVGTSENHARKPISLPAGGALYARCWFNRGDGVSGPYVSDIRILADTTCVRMPGPALESVVRSGTSNIVKWEPSPAQEAAAQRLYRATSPAGPWVQMRAFADNSTSLYSDSRLQGATHYYKVVAEGATGLPGAESNVLTD